MPHEQLLPAARELALAAVHNDQRAVRRMLRTYDEIAGSVYDPAWTIEDGVNRSWWAATFDPAAVAGRRDAVVTRGRDQATRGR